MPQYTGKKAVANAIVLSPLLWRQCVLIWRLMFTHNDSMYSTLSFYRGGPHTCIISPVIFLNYTCPATGEFDIKSYLNKGERIKKIKWRIHCVDCQVIVGDCLAFPPPLFARQEDGFFQRDPSGMRNGYHVPASPLVPAPCPWIHRKDLSSCMASPRGKTHTSKKTTAEVG